MPRVVAACLAARVGHAFPVMSGIAAAVAFGRKWHSLCFGALVRDAGGAWGAGARRRWTFQLLDVVADLRDLV